MRKHAATIRPDGRQPARRSRKALALAGTIAAGLLALGLTGVARVRAHNADEPSYLAYLTELQRVRAYGWYDDETNFYIQVGYHCGGETRWLGRAATGEGSEAWLVPPDLPSTEVWSPTPSALQRLASPFGPTKPSWVDDLFADVHGAHGRLGRVEHLVWDIDGTAVRWAGSVVVPCDTAVVSEHITDDVSRSWWTFFAGVGLNATMMHARGLWNPPDGPVRGDEGLEEWCATDGRRIEAQLGAHLSALWDAERPFYEERGDRLYWRNGREIVAVSTAHSSLLGLCGWTDPPGQGAATEDDSAEGASE